MADLKMLLHGDLTDDRAGTVMGLDYGSVTVGVAVSDGLGLTASGLETITRKAETKLRRTLARIESLVKEHQVRLIVLGLPVHMDGSEGERVAYARVFKEKLENRVHIPVVWHDERLTTFEAKEILKEKGISPADYKKHLDRVAAALILQDYLDSNRSTKTDQ